MENKGRWVMAAQMCGGECTPSFPSLRIIVYSFLASDPQPALPFGLEDNLKNFYSRTRLSSRRQNFTSREL